MLDREEIARLTQEYGGDWATNHTKRLLHLVSALGEGLDYDADAVWVAAHLHDWGGYQAWAVPGVEHYDRSVEVAREFLAQRECPADKLELVIECIQFHHGGGPDRSIESILLADADALDLLGVVGFARCFAMNFRNLEGGMATVRNYRDASLKAILLPKTRELAARRIEETEELLRKFEEETFGDF